jgi:mono/diheme cytochrome c family protein
MKTPRVIFVFVIIGVVATMGFVYSGFYDVSASSPHSGMVNWLLSTTARASIERHAKGVEVPGLGDEALALAGVNDFDSMCKGCHGAPGQDPEAMGQGLNPPAPDLAVSAADMTPAELFWVTKNGIKMTGMPAWGATHDDDAIWPVVALLQKLPDLDAAGYQTLLASAAGFGHHADNAADDELAHASGDHASDDADHDAKESAGQQHDESEQRDDAPQVQEEHDHSTHEH